jgi:hypothetical protein
MRRVSFDPNTLPPSALKQWHAAIQSARDAIDAVISAKEPDPRKDDDQRSDPAWNSALWRVFKNLLLTHVYGGNCAYCEGDVEATAWGDADHWRPKGKVTVRTQLGEEVTIDHPGYYWLAYSWENLLPACQRCNSLFKGTQCPVESGHCNSRAEGETPDELDALERPLLLHPSRGDPPELHIRFDPFGEAQAVLDADGKESPMGRASIDVFGLNRAGLPAKRRKEFQRADASVDRAIELLWEDGIPFEQTLAVWLEPGARYSHAIRDHADRRLQRALEEQADELARQESELAQRAAELESAKAKLAQITAQRSPRRNDESRS